MTERTQDSIEIRWPNAHDDTIEVWVNNRCVARLEQAELGSKTIQEVIRVLELAAGALGILFFR